MTDPAANPPEQLKTESNVSLLVIAHTYTVKPSQTNEEHDEPPKVQTNAGAPTMQPQSTIGLMHWPAC